MGIPDKVIKRLSLYHFILEDCGCSEKFISSTRIAELLGTDDSQVRKDIKYLNNSGKCRVGYNIKELKKAIETGLGLEKTKNAFVIGAGNFGAALVKYDNFECYGLKILALFDVDKNKIGTTINNKPVFSLEQLPKLVKENNVNLALLTVPKNVASEVASFLAKSGVKYIWNFTTCILNLPTDVKVRNENLIGSFLLFTKNDGG